MQQQGVVVKKASPDITLAIAFYSPDGSHDALFISNYVTLQLKDEIARLPGVGDITIFGVRDYSMRLWLDPDKLAARSITAGRCRQRSQRTECPGGGGNHRRATTLCAELRFPIHG